MLSCLFNNCLHKCLSLLLNLNINLHLKLLLVNLFVVNIPLVISNTVVRNEKPINEIMEN